MPILGRLPAPALSRCALALAICVPVVDVVVAADARACGGYMAEVISPERRQRARAEIVAELRQAERALEEGRHADAVRAAAAAWRSRAKNWEAVDDTALVDRIDAVALAAIVYTHGAWGLDDAGNVDHTRDPREADGVLRSAHVALQQIVERAAGRATTDVIELPLAVEAVAVAGVLLAPSATGTEAAALIALYKAGGVTTPEGLSVVGRVAGAVDEDEIAQAAAGLCVARAVNVRVCTTTPAGLLALAQTTR